MMTPLRLNSASLPANGTYCAIRDSARHHFVVRRLAKCPDASQVGRSVLQETAVSNSCLDRGRGQKPSSSSSSSSFALVGVSWSRLSARALPSLNESILSWDPPADRPHRPTGHWMRRDATPTPSRLRLLRNGLGARPACLPDSAAGGGGGGDQRGGGGGGMDFAVAVISAPPSFSRLDSIRLANL